MTSKPTIHAVVLAGGRSERMGSQKLAIKLGSRTVLERIVDALAESSLNSILVMLGPTASHLRLHLKSGSHVLLLDEQTPDMRATLERAIRHLETSESLKDDDGVLVVLGDQPTLNASTVVAVVNAFQKDPTRIVVPVHNGRRGHPVLLPWKRLYELLSLPPNFGLNAILRDPSSSVCEVPTADAEILLDLDVPADLERLSKRFWD